MFLSIGARGLEPSFLPGTQLTFMQPKAPVGWVRVTTFDDAALRVVSATPSSGGVNGFSTVMAQTGTGTGSTGTGTTGTGTSGATTLATTQIASHTHTYTTQTASASFNGACFCFSTTLTPIAENSGSTGTGGSHTHSIPGLSIPALSVPSLSLTMNMKYVDALIARRV